jgi:hypothetical protein
MNKSTIHNLRAPALTLIALACAFSANAATISVNCPSQTIQSGVNGATAGDIIQVSGTCSENVFVPNEKARLTINGGGTAVLNALSSASPAILIRGRGIALVGMTINGGLHGVNVDRVANAVIDHNTISGAVQSGVLVDQQSFAVITNNTIESNGNNGVHVAAGATARIGFWNWTDTSPSPNTIQNNTNNGIEVGRQSSAEIAGNTIGNNGNNGIAVYRLSSAVIASNAINANGFSATPLGNGVIASGNSVVQFGEDNPTNFLGLPNTTTSNNANYGIKCQLGAAVMGHLGSSNPLMGSTGQNSIDATCPQALVTP